MRATVLRPAVFIRGEKSIWLLRYKWHRCLPEYPIRGSSSYPAFRLGFEPSTGAFRAEVGVHGGVLTTGSRPGGVPDAQSIHGLPQQGSSAR